MKNFKTNIKQKYNMSNYQVEQIVFVFKSVGSELSKMLIMGILFQNEILLFLFQLIVMCLLRSFSGGFHFYSYWSCLLASVLYMSSLVFIFPNITLPLYMQIFLLSISFCICYLIGPVLSKYRINFPKKQLYFCRNVTCSIIFLFSLILYILPQNRYMVAGSWMIILHSLQLLAAKILAKGGRINDI